MPSPSFIIPRCGESNEKPCVCNVFATPYSKNLVKSSVPRYLNVNLKLRKNLEASSGKTHLNMKKLGNCE